MPMRRVLLDQLLGRGLLRNVLLGCHAHVLLLLYGLHQLLARVLLAYWGHRLRWYGLHRLSLMHRVHVLARVDLLGLRLGHMLKVLLLLLAHGWLHVLGWVLHGCLREGCGSHVVLLLRVGTLGHSILGLHLLRGGGWVHGCCLTLGLLIELGLLGCHLGLLLWGWHVLLLLGWELLLLLGDEGLTSILVVDGLLLLGLLLLILELDTLRHHDVLGLLWGTLVGLLLYVDGSCLLGWRLGVAGTIINNRGSTGVISSHLSLIS